MEKLYLVHCGFYDPKLADGIFESHTNFFVIAQNFNEARLKAKELEGFKQNRMHVDGLLEVQSVCGHRIFLERDPTLDDSETQIVSNRHRDLA